jgi:glycosyltransferase involved in cell wall biosynthesis
LERTDVIPNGVDAEHFRSGKQNQDLVSSWDLHGRTVIAFIGSFYHYEGLDLLIEAFAAIAAQRSDLRLLLVGDGELTHRLRPMAEGLGVSGQVVLPGSVPYQRIPAVYSMADILVYPRYSMRLTELVTPLKPLEAMAMGKVTVASDVGGHRELIQHDKTGVLFPAGDARGLAAALEGLLENPQRRESIARESMRWVNRSRSWETTTSGYDGVYRQAMESRSIRLTRVSMSDR